MIYVEDIEFRFLILRGTSVPLSIPRLQYRVFFADSEDPCAQNAPNWKDVPVVVDND